MATAATIDVLLRANTAQYRAEMMRSSRIANQALGSIQRDAARTSQAIQNAARVTAGFISIQALRAGAAQLGRVADQYSDIRARVRLAAGEHANLTQALDQVFQVSQRTFNSFESTSALVQRGAIALRNYGLDAESAFSNAVRLAEIFNKALVVSGASASEAAAATLQFSQALASGRFQGDEFRSVMENNTRFAQLLADSLGVTISQLRDMSKEGKLTTQSFLALVDQADSLDREFSQMPVTIGRAWTVLSNEVVKYVGEADQAYRVSSQLSAAIVSLASNISPVASAMGQLAVVVAGAFAARAIQGVREYGRAVLARAEAERAAAGAAQQRIQAEQQANLQAVQRARAEQLIAEQSARAAQQDRIRIEQTIAMARAQEAMIRANALRSKSEIELARLSQQLTAVESARLAATEALAAARQREIQANAALVVSNRNLSTAMQAAGLAGAGAGQKITLAMRASQAATAAMTLAARGLSTALALVGGPLGLVIIGLSTLALKLAGARAEAEGLAQSTAAATEALAALNRESSAEQILSAGKNALAERQRRLEQIDLIQRRLSQYPAGPDIFGFRARDEAELHSAQAALAELNRQLENARGIALNYQGVQKGVADATADAGNAAGEHAKKLVQEAEALRLQRFELEHGLRARLLLEAMQAAGVSSVEALDAATREHIESIVAEREAIDRVNKARKDATAGQRAAEREAQRLAREQEKLNQAALQAATELQGILQSQAATLGGPAVAAATAYANEMLRLLMIEQDLVAASKLNAEAQAQLAAARQGAFDVYQEALAAQHESARRIAEDIEFEIYLLGLSNAAKEREIALRQANAQAGTEEYRRIVEGMEELQRLRKEVEGQSFFRDSLSDLFVDVGRDISKAREALDDFFDRLRTRALEALSERLLDKIFGPRDSTQGGASGQGFWSWIGQVFGGFAEGGFTGFGPKYQPAGFVHKGEGVLTQQEVAALGGPAGFEALRQAIRNGFADGGVVTANGAQRIPVAGAAPSRGRARALAIGGDTFVFNVPVSRRSMKRLEIEKRRAQDRWMRERG